MTTLRNTGEHETIERLSRLLSGSPDVRCGVGDDCAIVKTSDKSPVEWLFTSDPVISGTHFTPDSNAQSVGHKAVGRILSDIAAMGGNPRFILINIAADTHIGIDYLETVYKGANQIATAFQCAIVGGDLSRAESMQIHVFGAGTAPAGKAVLRSGADKGQALLVTGTLGGSASGKHMTFTPRVKEGMWLRERGYARSMIDVSDGLARDTTHLARAAGVRINIARAKLPLSSHLDPGGAVNQALYDGEDFELLFTVEQGKLRSLLKEWADHFDVPLTHIGEVTSGEPAALLDNTIIELADFSHF